MTEREAKMLEEIVHLKMKLMLAVLGSGKCHNVMYPLENELKCREDGDCRKCRELWIHRKKLEVRKAVMERYGLTEEEIID